ncbi:hypothetical protein PVK06_026954 [Gossypium arboreum]|uniref:Uncharacterized protein n=1 Tax=Gossypium arboreum TaxID=29729 RepID=A0ABR0NZ29_GOSAR|nr:hypothetical protein PVK06_026954 [Gossypium arboreum]
MPSRSHAHLPIAHCIARLALLSTCCSNLSCPGRVLHLRLASAPGLLDKAPLIMPRKRTRACAQFDETQNKFYYEEAKERYESIFKNQQLHPEKGFTLKESNYKDFMARIRQVTKALIWELFCEKRPSVDEELVCEFYANLTSSELMELPVCEIKVPITSNAIN